MAMLRKVEQGMKIEEMKRTAEDKIQLLNLSEELSNISEACRRIGYSRESFYRFKKQYHKGGKLALQPKNRKKPNLKNRFPKEIEDAILDLTFKNPARGKDFIAFELQDEEIYVSPEGVRLVWLRHNIETVNKRVLAMEDKAKQEEMVLDDYQLEAVDFVIRNKRVKKEDIQNLLSCRTRVMNGWW